MASRRALNRLVQHQEFFKVVRRMLPYHMVTTSPRIWAAGSDACAGVIVSQLEGTMRNPELRMITRHVSKSKQQSNITEC